MLHNDPRERCVLSFKPALRLLNLALVVLLLNAAAAASAQAQTAVITAYYESFSTDNIGAFQLNGDAILDGDRLRLTPALGTKAGSAWWKNRVTLEDERSFSTYFSFEIHSSGGGHPGGADGIVFAVQTESSGAGSSGGGLGYENISNSLGIEFDTWHNSEYSDPNANHIGLDLNGSVFSKETASLASVGTLDRGGVYHAWVDYDGPTGWLEVRVSASSTRPASPNLTHSINLEEVFGPDVYVGFTAATGGSWSEHEITRFYFNNDYVEGGLSPAETYSQAPARVTVSASPSSIPADGSTTSTVEATAWDLTGNPLSGWTIDFDTTVGSLSSASATTDSSGVATTQLSGTGAGTAVVRGTAEGGAYGETSVTLANLAPTIDQGASVSVQMDEDGSPTDFSLNLSGSDGNPDDVMSWSVQSQASHGTAVVEGTGSAPTILDYEPDHHYHGTDSFIVRVSDGNGGTDEVTVDVTIQSINDVPVCDPLSMTTDEDTPADKAADCSDPDDSSLTYQISTAPVSGTVSPAAVITFDPENDFDPLPSGDSDAVHGDFSYRACDGEACSDSAHVDVTVEGVNDAPVCQDVIILTDEDNLAGTGADCLDPDSGELTYSIAESPAVGTATVVNGSTLQFDPGVGYQALPAGGTDSVKGDFSYTAYDGQANSTAAVVDVTVEGLNDAPSDITLSGHSVDENEGIGTVVGDLSTDDKDAPDQHIYSLMTLEGCGRSDGSWDSEFFSVDNTDDTLSTSTRFDFESRQDYEICVRTEDTSGATYDKSFTVTVRDEPCDLGIGKAVDNSTPAEFWTVAYTVTVTNNGPDVAKEIVVSDTVPVSLTFDSAATTQGLYDVSTGVWDVGDLSSGLTASLLITASVDPGKELDVITNRAAITGLDQADSDTTNNQAESSIVVRGSEFEVVKTVDDGTPHEGQPFTYTISLTNHGYPSTAVISDLLPSGLEYVSADPSHGHYDPASGVWNAGTVDIDEKATLRVSASPMTDTAVPTGTTAITNTALLIDSSRLDPVPGNNSDAARISVQQAEAVEIELAPGAGGVLTYTNTGGVTTTVHVPGNAVTDAVTLIYTPITVSHGTLSDRLPDPTDPTARLSAVAFDLTAYRCPSCVPVPGFTFAEPITVMVHYSHQDIVGLQEDKLFLAYWDGAAWRDAAGTCGLEDPSSAYKRHPRENWLAVPVCHLTEFSLQGPAVPVGGRTVALPGALLAGGRWMLASLLAAGVIFLTITLKRTTD